ncbi:hypothetical protein Slin15195_G102380 [Septoria linicola]|uniref:Uncharacterized protein n=1 Tax=Septoria linicola TaxID=215465 RepID=A0A9Q9AXL3_9PEZI|nr:hypothetical protein Slin14017_G065380 [Septoria linicola]USW56919.1 hypothetical protein Slin15195_G102380 [Septoria linicola]
MGWHTIIHEDEALVDAHQHHQEQRRPSLALKTSSQEGHRRPSIPASLNNDPPSPSYNYTRRRSSILSPTTLSTLRLARQKSLTSRLLALPPELRNQIYTTYFSPSSSDSNIPRIKPDYTLPPLLKTCRQIYSEAIGLYYSSAPAFRCLDEDSAVKWLCALPEKFLSLIQEVRYDTRWIIFVTPYIPVPGAECWLCGKLVRRLEGRGSEVGRLLFLEGKEGDGNGEKEGDEGEEDEGGGEEEMEEMERGTGKLKVSFYRRGAENGIVWTNKPGLIEVVGEGAQ